mgnify:CR=1 FL=1
MDRVLRSSARLQELVPDAVLVGGSAAALYAHHRESFDHDHVLTDLADRYEQVLDAVEASDGWATSVRESKPPMTILGSLDGVEAGLRQLRRSKPLETTQFEIDADTRVIVPTVEEMLRVKAYLVVQRNYVRDYLNVVGLAGVVGTEQAVSVLGKIDEGRVPMPGSAFDSCLKSYRSALMYVSSRSTCSGGAVAPWLGSSSD